jgi:hypothetical protein
MPLAQGDKSELGQKVTEQQCNKAGGYQILVTGLRAAECGTFN